MPQPDESFADAILDAITAEAPTVDDINFETAATQRQTRIGDLSRPLAYNEILLPDPDPHEKPGRWYLLGPDPLDGTYLDGCNIPFERGPFTFEFVSALVHIVWYRRGLRPPSMDSPDELFGTIYKKLFNGGTWNDDDAANLGDDHPSMVWNGWDRPTGPWKTYLAGVVSHRITDALRSYGLLTPKEGRNVRRLSVAEETLEKELGRPPTVDELASTLEIGVDTVARWKRIRTYRLQLFADPSTSLGWIGAPDNVETTVLQRDVTNRVNEAMSQLDPDQRDVLIRRYGNGDSQQTIAKTLQVTPRTVHNREKQAINNLRTLLLDNPTQTS